MEVSLEGKVALVTGVGPNIGSGVALALSRYGARVACNDVDEAAIKACIARIERNGGEAMAASGDVTDEAAVQRYIGDVLARWGHIDILVNNAALLGGRGLLDETAENFERAVRVSSLGYFLNSKHVGPLDGRTRDQGLDRLHLVIQCLVRDGGHHRLRVPQGRREQLRPGRRHGPRAVRHPGQQLHPDRAEPGQPGTARGTGQGRAGPGRGPAAARPGLGGPTGDEPWRRPSRWAGPRAPMVPMGTTGTPTDIGHAVAWLCSDYARLITGTDLVVDGGARAKNFAYAPAAPEDLAGPLPLIVLDETPEFAGPDSA